MRSKCGLFVVTEKNVLWLVVRCKKLSYLSKGALLSLPAVAVTESQSINETLQLIVRYYE